MVELPKVILGTNPFDGVSYLSRAQAHEYLEKFSKEQNIKEIIESALNLGINIISCSYNERVVRVLESFPSERKMQVIPVVPNAYEYVRESSHRGILGAVSEKLEHLDAFQKLKFALKEVTQLKGVLSGELKTLLRAMLELELAPFSDFKIPAVILHGHIADLAITGNNQMVFEIYADFIRNSFKAEPFVATHNFGFTLPKYEKWDVGITGILAPFNKKGFMMKPNVQTCETLLKITKKQIIAKKILAGGRISPEEAVNYLKDKNFSAVMVGVGSVSEAYHTLTVIKNFCQQHT